MKWRNITISGDIGTGKTTLARNLSLKLGWKYFNLGDFIRGWYKESGFSLQDVNLIPPDLDRKLDEDFKKRIAEDQETIFESRLAGYLSRKVPDVLRVLCLSDITTVVERVAKRDNLSLKEAKTQALTRSKSLREKFERLYKIDDYLNPKYFNLVIDTARLNQQQSLQRVLDTLNQ